jgi:hypothetical protein
MMRPFLLAASLAVFVFASPFAHADHKDARLGFTIQTPRGWTQLPQQAAEKWIVGAYQSDKVNVYTEKGGWTTEHRPDMEMIAFVSEDLKKRADIQHRKDKKGNDEWAIEIISPYKDYQDYMQRRYQGGGWFINKEDKTKVGDVEVTTYDIKVEKLSQDGPKHIITWIYHTPDVDIAVQFECLADAWPKLQNDFTRCLKSFKQKPRSGEALSENGDVSTGHKLNLFDLDDMTPEERKNARMGMEKEIQDKAAKKVPDGWTAKRMGRFLVLNHADEKFAKMVVDQAEAVWGWLDATFPFVGEGEYVRAPVLRICKDRNELEAFARAAGYFSLNDLEITTYQDFEGKDSWAMGSVNQRILDIWFQDKDRELYWAMPGWMGNGLAEVVRKLHTKNGKVTFGRDEWAQEDVRTAVRQGSATKPRELMTMTKEDFMRDWANFQQAQMLVGFFVSGEAAKSTKTKTVLQEYVKGVKAIQLQIKEEDKAKGGDKDKKPTTEEEEDAQFKNQRQGYKDKEKRILEGAKQKAFAGWTDKDWDTFESVYFKAIT